MMSATGWKVKAKPESSGMCIHGRSLEQPCLECEAYVREYYSELAPKESATIQ